MNATQARVFERLQADGAHVIDTGDGVHWGVRLPIGRFVAIETAEIAVVAEVAMKWIVGHLPGRCYDCGADAGDNRLCDEHRRDVGHLNRRLRVLL